MISTEATDKKPGCQRIYDWNGNVLFLGEWDSRALFAALSSGDDAYWQGRRVLDIGANTGGLSLELARRGAEVIAIEPDPYSNNRALALDLTRNLASSEGLTLTFEKAGLFEADTFGRFDSVLCLGLIYHFRDPQYCLDYLSTIEMEHLFVSTQTAPGGMIALVNRRDTSVLPNAFLPEDIVLSGWHPTRPLFERMLQWAGFDDVQPLTDPSINFPQKPPGLTNSGYYRATRTRTIKPVDARETYFPR